MKVSYKTIKRWYLEMDTKPYIGNLEYPYNTLIKEFEGDVNEYRQINRMIGEDLGWVDRQIMPENDLKFIIQKKEIKIFVLYQGDEVIGYSEIDFSNKDIVILEYFGLVPKARGKGLGKFLLWWTINEVWKHNPSKFKLHTSDQDHPNALRNYLKAGFRIVDEKMEQQAVIND